VEQVLQIRYIICLQTSLTVHWRNWKHQHLPSRLYTQSFSQLFYCCSGICPGLPGWAGTRKVKPIWIYWSKRY